jgi:hypothetical protein
MSAAVKSIRLPSGATLEVDVMPGFLEAVASRFSLAGPSSVSDDHIRLYLCGALKNAIDRAENEQTSSA